MSGDSPDHQPYKKKEEEADLLVTPERKAPTATVLVGAVATSDKAPTENVPATSVDDKQQLLHRHDSEDTKDAGGDTKDEKLDEDKDYLENNDNTRTMPLEDKPRKGKVDDTDSVYLRPPPPHKARSTNNSISDDESCGMKCLYYTVQCCDCVLM